MSTFVIIATEEDETEMGTHLGIQNASTPHKALAKEANNFLDGALKNKLTEKTTVALAEWLMSEPDSFQDVNSIDEAVDEITNYEPGEFKRSMMAIQATHHKEPVSPPVYDSGELEW